MRLFKRFDPDRIMRSSFRLTLENKHKKLKIGGAQMNTNITIPKLLIITVLLIFPIGCANYSKEVRKALERAYHVNFPSYTFRETPVANFGVGTIYDAEVTRKDINASNVENEWLLAHPNTWYIDSLSDEKKTEINRKIFEEGSLGSVRLEEDISTKLKLETTIPSIKQVLGGAEVNYENGVKVEVKASEAVNRQMNWCEFVNTFKSGHFKKYIDRIMKRGDFVICAKDVILKGYTVEIVVDLDVNPILYAKLNDEVGKTFVGIGSSFNISVGKTKRGTFEVKTMGPVIAAVMYKSPPSIGDSIFGNIRMPRIEDWNNVAISHAVQLWEEGKLWQPELISLQPGMYSCVEPQTIDLGYKGAKFSIPAREAASTMMMLATGKVNVRADPKIVSLTSQLSQNELMKSYIKCLGRHCCDYSYEQITYIDKLNAFLATAPTIEEVLSWQKKYPFPRQILK
jgi:hypothetical protein